MTRKIAISIRGSLVSAVFLDSHEELEAYVLDHDTESASDSDLVEIDGEDVICYSCDTIPGPNPDVFRDIASWEQTS
ncbi:hypothetical protein GGI1_02597 [Acidithiobacillus sp. GGI-221]|nr:hypothetical protein GGI1_02597 [Acidithiobacillus sp. GGI-221]